MACPESWDGRCWLFYIEQGWGRFDMQLDITMCQMVRSGVVECSLTPVERNAFRTMADVHQCCAFGGIMGVRVSFRGVIIPSRIRLPLGIPSDRYFTAIGLPNLSADRATLGTYFRQNLLICGVIQIIRIR